MRLQQVFFRPIFFLTFLIGFLVMLSLNLYQLDWLSYFLYPEVWYQIDFGSLDLWLAVVIALLVGFNLGGFVYLTRCDVEAAGKEGFLGLLGAIVGWFAFYCVACQTIFLTFFGTAIAAELVAPWAPVFRVFSLILLLVASWILVRRIKSPSCRI